MQFCLFWTKINGEHLFLENLDSHLSRKARPLPKCMKKYVNIVINKASGVSP